MEKKIFQAPASVQGISTLRDHTLKLIVYISRELPAEQKSMLFDLEGKEGWFLLSENIFQTSDIPTETAKIDRNVKSSSQRLYAVLFVEYKQSKSTMDFNRWREIEMETIINERKNRLN